MIKYDIEKTEYCIRYLKKGIDCVHREDGPAYIRKDGYISYFINNQWHREDGPSQIYPPRTIYYCIKDQYYSENEFYKKVAK